MEVTVQKKLRFIKCYRNGSIETLSWEYPFPDRSWELELNEFYKDISQNRIPDPGLNEVKIILEIINTIYKKFNYDFSS